MVLDAFFAIEDTIMQIAAEYRDEREAHLNAKMVVSSIGLNFHFRWGALAGDRRNTRGDAARPLMPLSSSTSGVPVALLMVTNEHPHDLELTRVVIITELNANSLGRSTPIPVECLCAITIVITVRAE